MPVAFLRYVHVICRLVHLTKQRHLQCQDDSFNLVHRFCGRPDISVLWRLRYYVNGNVSEHLRVNTEDFSEVPAVVAHLVRARPLNTPPHPWFLRGIR